MLETPKKVRELQRKLYQKAKQEKEIWGYKRSRPQLSGLRLRKPLEEDDRIAVCEKIACTV